MPVFVALRAFNHSSNVRVPGIFKLVDPTGLTATAVATGGTFAANTYYWEIVAVAESGTTLPSNEATATIVLNGSAKLAWPAVAGAVSYNVYRTTTSGTYTTPALVASGVTTNSYTDTGTAVGTGTVPGSNNSYSTKEQKLTPTTDVVVDVDKVMVRRALNNHRSIGQYIQTGVNATYRADVSTISSLPSNS